MQFVKIRFIALYICVWTLAGLPTIAATLTVTTTADSGAGSLRDTIAAALNGDTIQFDPALNGQAITLTSTELLINKDLIIHGPGASQLTVMRSAVGGTPAFRIFEIQAGHTVNIEGLTISNGLAQGSEPAYFGGGIFNNGSTLTIANSVISSNSAFDGGGILTANAVHAGGAMTTINNSTISGNSAGYGGGILSYGRDSGSVMTTINNSTVSGNSAGLDGGNGAGGIQNLAGGSASATMEILSSTVSENHTSGSGGGIANTAVSGGDAALTISNSTISGNSATFSPAGIFNQGGLTTASCTITNSTIADNLGVSIENFGEGVTHIKGTILAGDGRTIEADSGTFFSDGYNLSDDDGGGFLNATGDQTNTNPVLGPLHGNGGPTSTHELMPGSPAINAGNPDFTPPPDNDQRGAGFPRVSHGRIDIGSFEVQTALVTPTPTPSATPLVVTTTADSGAGSLRDAIVAAQNGDTIQFAPALSGQAITLTSASLLIAKDLNIVGPGPNLLTVTRSTVGGTPNFRIFAITGFHTVTISGITISNGHAQTVGGGIYNDGSTVTLTNTVISGNAASFGGGIYSTAVNSGSAELVVNASTITGNTAKTSGGAIYSNGYGDFVPASVFASVELNDTTVSDNSAQSGGAIFSNGTYAGYAVVAVRNSTISGNTASETGGGIYNWGFAKPTFALVLMNNSTVSGNSASSGGGAIYNDGDDVFYAPQVMVGNTILKTGAVGENILTNVGHVDSSGYNLSDDDGGGFLDATGDQVNTDPMLGPLANNGGPTRTHQLLAGSPALNAGSPTFTPPPDYDQRGPGFPRVVGGRIDIGSIEGTNGPPTQSTFLNISTRLRVLTGDNALIGGFIVTGTVPKRVIVRGIGPSLTKFGVPDALADPLLELHGPAGFNTIQNDNWADTQQGEILGTGLAPSDELESAIVAILQPGAYTAVLTGNSGGIGVGLVEAYDLNAATSAQLTNISTRGFVDSGDNAMIGGFIVGSGSISATVLIRGIGPSLANFGVPDPLADPTLELHDNNGAKIGSNDDWRQTQEKDIEATGLAPSDDRESAILDSFVQGAYTAIVRGKSGAVGVALVEAYQLTGASASRRDPNLTASFRPFGISESRGDKARNRWARTKK